MLSGHADGTIVRYFLEDDGGGLSKVGMVALHNREILMLYYFHRGQFVGTPVLLTLWPGAPPPSWLLAVTGRSQSMALMVTHHIQFKHIV